MVQPLVIPTAEVVPEDEFSVEATKFWRRERDLAAVLYYIRKSGPPSVEFLISPTQYAASANRVWNEGVSPRRSPIRPGPTALCEPVKVENLYAINSLLLTVVVVIAWHEETVSLDDCLSKFGGSSQNLRWD